MSGELFSEERSAEVVAASFAGTPGPRLRQVLTSLVGHLHDFVEDVELTLTCRCWRPEALRSFRGPTEATSTRSRTRRRPTCR